MLQQEGCGRIFGEINFSSFLASFTCNSGAVESNKVDINYSLVSHVAFGRYSYLNHGIFGTEGVNINIHLRRTPYGRMNFMSKTSLRLFIYFRHRLRVEKQFSNHPTC